MRKTSFVPTMYLTLGLALTPAAAFANHGGFHGGRVAVGQVAGGPVVTRPFMTHPFVSHPFVAHPFLLHRFFRPFVPFGVMTSPVVIYAEPPAAPPAEAPAPREESPARPSQLYRWTDERDVVHWTDRWDAVPQRYRAQAKQTQPS